MRTREPLASVTGVSSESQRCDLRLPTRSVGGSRSLTERSGGGGETSRCVGAPAASGTLRWWDADGCVRAGSGCGRGAGGCDSTP
jgi:hypothetical protein